MNGNLISIIIPTCDKGHYIIDCLESISAQIYQNYEALIIENGSKDNTRELVEGYIKSDSRFKLHVFDRLGVSEARNIGLNLSKGDYITFIDSDDFISEDFLQLLIGQVSCEEVDIVVGRYLLYYSKTKQIKTDMVYRLNEYNGDDKKFLFPDGFACGKLYRAELIKNNNIKFDKDLFFGEDFLFFLEALIRCRRVRVDNNPIYYYRQNIVGQITSGKKDFNCVRNLLFSFSKLSYLVEKLGVVDIYSPYIAKKYINFIIGEHFGGGSLSKLPCSEIKKVIKPLRTYLISIEGNDKSLLPEWQRRTYTFFQYLVKHGSGYCLFLKSMRLLRNILLQPLRIEIK